MFRMPWILAADCNAAPAEVEELPWLRYVDGVVVHTGSITCTAAECGSNIDFLVVSSDFRGYATLDILDDVPWRPHLGLSIKVQQPKEPEPVRVLRAPPSVELLPLTKKEREEWL